MVIRALECILECLKCSSTAGTSLKTVAPNLGLPDVLGVQLLEILVSRPVVKAMGRVHRGSSGVQDCESPTLIIPIMQVQVVEGGLNALLNPYPRNIKK